MIYNWEAALAVRNPVGETYPNVDKSNKIISMLISKWHECGTVNIPWKGAETESSRTLSTFGVWTILRLPHHPKSCLHLAWEESILLISYVRSSGVVIPSLTLRPRGQSIIPPLYVTVYIYLKDEMNIGGIEPVVVDGDGVLLIVNLVVPACNVHIH